DATPLHHAVCSGELAAVQVLIEAGAKLDTKDTAWGGTPLGWAEHYVEQHAGDEREADYARIAAYLRERQRARAALREATRRRARRPRAGCRRADRTDRPRRARPARPAPARRRCRPPRPRPRG